MERSKKSRSLDDYQDFSCVRTPLSRYTEVVVLELKEEKSSFLFRVFQDNNSPPHTY